MLLSDLPRELPFELIRETNHEPNKTHNRLTNNERISRIPTSYIMYWQVLNMSQFLEDGFQEGY